jgi:hypothetical protein
MGVDWSILCLIRHAGQLKKCDVFGGMGFVDIKITPHTDNSCSVIF